MFFCDMCSQYQEIFVPIAGSTVCEDLMKGMTPVKLLFFYVDRQDVTLTSHNRVGGLNDLVSNP